MHDIVLFLGPSYWPIRHGGWDEASQEEDGAEASPVPLHHQVPGRLCQGGGVTVCMRSELI